MKLFIAFFALVVWSAQSLACDETCKREKAMQEHGVSFPGYLNADFCKTTSNDFLLRDIKDLEKYRSDHLLSGHKGGMNNIRKLLEQRKEWLIECDEYLRLTGQGRVFRNEETTEVIFTAIDRVTGQLNGMIYNGDRSVTVTSGIDVAEQRFDTLFNELEKHKTDLQLRGQLVIR
ncbi:MAG TPA: hypothetical protein VIC08_12280 [Cellvibrionaceae bacterium]